MSGIGKPNPRRSRDRLAAADRRYGTYLLYAALFFQYARPQEFVPGLSAIPIAGALIYGCAIWGIFHVRKDVLLSPVRIVLVLGILFGVSGIGAESIIAYKVSLEHIFVIFPLCISVYVLVDSTDRIKRLFQLWSFIYFIIAVITISKGGLGPGGFSENQNDAALVLCMGLPYIIYLARWKRFSATYRMVLWIAAIVVVSAIITTRSRGGFLGLAVVGLGFWWFSRQRLKLAVIAIVSVIILGGLMFSTLPEGYIAEMESISDTQNRTRIERLRSWEIAWIMYKDNPVLGVGASNFQYNAGKYQKMTSYWTGYEKSLQGRVTHSAYFQIISELGTIGLLFYGYIMFVLPLKLYKRRNAASKPDQHPSFILYCNQILIVSIAAFLVSGAFLSVAYYPLLPTWIALYAVIIREDNGERVDRRSEREVTFV